MKHQFFSPSLILFTTSLLLLSGVEKSTANSFNSPQFATNQLSTEIRNDGGKPQDPGFPGGLSGGGTR